MGNNHQALPSLSSLWTSVVFPDKFDCHRSQLIFGPPRWTLLLKMVVGNFLGIMLLTGRMALARSGSGSLLDSMSTRCLGGGKVTGTMYLSGAVPRTREMAPSTVCSTAGV